MKEWYFRILGCIDTVDQVNKKIRKREKQAEEEKKDAEKRKKDQDKS
jgi:hypothetical protein